MHSSLGRFSEFAIGLLFGIGLILGGMTNPAKIIGFLDFFGTWDPSLAFVMGGAVTIAFFAFRLAKGRSSSLLGRVIVLDDMKRIDAKLITGSAIFGIGWGLSGFCPGPALVSLGTGEWKTVLFVIAMLIGSFIASRRYNRAG
jgi:uncharacterized membrane protein YedE/YeeE